MKRIAHLSILMISFFFFEKVKAQSIFYLKDTFTNADLNYAAITDINQHCCDSLFDRVFNVVNGKFTVNRYLRYSSPNNKNTIHNNRSNREVIILKTSNHVVVDAYYCPLDWKELPISGVLLKSVKRPRLRKSMLIEDFDFRPVDSNGISILRAGSVLRK